MADNAEVLTRQRDNKGHSIEARANEYNFDQHMENFSVESSAMQRKLQSKIDALRIMRKEVERFRTERDQFKLMAETLQLRYTALTKKNGIGLDNMGLSGSGNVTVASLLRETRERNMNLTTEVEALKQKLGELQGDIEVLRLHEKRKESPISNASRMSSMLSSAESQWKADRADFICHVEKLKRKNAQMAFDMKSLLDEKHELITERDAYKCKAHRLNHELRNALKANERYPKLIDIDSIILENKFLHECLKNTENELENCKTINSKYKAMLETKKRKNFLRMESAGQKEANLILSQKQVNDMMENGIDLPTRTETVHDIKSLCLMLLDTLNDKNTALCHQRKANKMLAMKIGELERRIQLLLGKEWSDVNKDGFSPTEALLYMYCPSSVDSTSSTGHILEINTDTSDNSTDITARSVESETQNLNRSFKTANGAIAEQSNYDDASSSSSKSVHSIISSEYGSNEMSGCHLKSLASVAMLNFETPSSSSSKNTSSSKNSKFSLPNSLAQERKDTLRDLPVELAQLVEKALHELDMRDFEVENISISPLPAKEDHSEDDCHDKAQQTNAKDYNSDSSANETTV